MQTSQNSYQTQKNSRSLGVLAILALIAGLLAIVASAGFATTQAYASSTDIQSVYRMYNETTSEHLYTTEESEYDSLVSEGWNQEGVSWYSPKQSVKGVYRLYNADLGAQFKMSHHYTTNYEEAADLVENQGWAWDNNAQPIFYSAQDENGNLLSDNSVEATYVFRMYNDGLSAHLFTMDNSEKEVNVAKNGWDDEGTGFYAYKYKCVSEGHTYGDWSVNKASSCSEAGSKSRTCAVCGHEETTTIPALSHVYQWVDESDATCTEDGLSVEKCALCGFKTGKTVVLPALGHNFVNDKCTRCGIKDVVGKTVTLGSYEQDNNTSNGKEAIQWQVLDAKVVDGETQGLLVSVNALDCKKYNDDLTHLTWETSSIRSWLNSDFYNTAFSSADKASVATTELSNSANSEYSTAGGNATTDNVFLLSASEANTLFKDTDTRACYATEYAIAQGAKKYANGDCSWWLRTPGKYDYTASAVNPNGDIDLYGGDVNFAENAVRPAVWAVL